MSISGTSREEVISVTEKEELVNNSDTEEKTVENATEEEFSEGIRRDEECMLVGPFFWLSVVTLFPVTMQEKYIGPNLILTQLLP